MILFHFSSLFTQNPFLKTTIVCFRMDKDFLKNVGDIYFYFFFWDKTEDSVFITRKQGWIVKKI